MAIDSLSGPVTQNEINSFKTYMLTQVPDPTPWGALNGTGHNNWGDGVSGNALEAFGLMYETTGDIQILTNMIHWTDICVSERNDLMAATNGGQRVMWTNGIAKVWAPNAPTSTYPTYAGGENGDTKAHIAYTALLILQNPALWNQTIPDGNPFGYGTTYFQRATNYIAKCDEGHDGYDYIFYTASNLIRNPPGWPSGFHTMEANNIQMMLLGYVERLAQCHEILGDDPVRLAKYEAIAKAALSESINGMANCHPGTTNGHAVYAWCYYPWSVYPNNLESVGHAAYDMVGVYRAFNRVSYGFTLSLVKPFGTAEAYVMNVASNTFSAWVNGTGTTQNYMQAQWLMLADWDPAVWDITAPANLASGRYKTTTLMDATMLWMKNRRYLEFAVTPAPLSKSVAVGAGTTFTLTVAPLGGFTNAVSLAIAGLPPGATGILSSAAINLAALNFAYSNVTLSINTSTSTPAGTYAVSVIGTSGSVSHTNVVSLTVGNFSLSASPPSQVVSLGNSANYVVSLATNSGFTGSVSLGVTGLALNMGAAFNPGSLSGAGNSTLTLTTSNNTPPGSYTLNLTGTNGTVVADATVGLVVVAEIPVWTGGSSSGGYWSDTANWGGVALAPGNALIFSGSSRLNNTNDTAAVTTYSNIVFSAGASAFVLNGNAVNLVGNIANNSSVPQTIAFGLNFNTSLTFDGANGPLIIAGGLTNTLGASGSTRLLLAGTGTLKNLLGITTSPGGTNVLGMNSGTANWTLLDNDSSTPVTVPWEFSITNGTFNFGDEDSAPTLSLTAVQGLPTDFEVGRAANVTGTFNMNAGTLTTVSRFNTGTTVSGSTGVVNQVGGTLNIGNQFQGANVAGGNSIVNVNGVGNMNVGGAGSGTLYVASRGNGALTVSDAAVVNCGTLDVSRGVSSTLSKGTVNLNGGTLQVNGVTDSSTTAGGSAAFNFNGGTLKAKTSSATFFQQSATIPLVTTIQAGGAIIDTAAFNVTVPLPLLHDSGLGGIADGGLIKLGAGTLTLTATNAYNGDTLVNGGRLALSGSGSIGTGGTVTVTSGAVLDASQRTNGTLMIGTGQTLTGGGSVMGNVVVSSGGTLAPGGNLNTLTFGTNLTLSDGSTTVMEISNSAATNDSAQVTGNVVYGGTLVVTNVSVSPLGPDDSFKLFNAGGYSGSFAEIIPAIPGTNLAWNTDTLATDGTLRIVSVTPSLQFVSMTANGTNWIFTGNNGVSNGLYYVLSTTNLSLPLTDWVEIVTNTFDDNGAFIFTNPVAPGRQHYFCLKRQVTP